MGVLNICHRPDDSGIGFENCAKLLRSSKSFGSRNSKRKIVENESVRSRNCNGCTNNEVTREACVVALYDKKHQ